MIDGIDPKRPDQLPSYGWIVLLYGALTEPLDDRSAYRPLIRTFTSTSGNSAVAARDLAIHCAKSQLEQHSDIYEVAKVHIVQLTAAGEYWVVEDDEDGDEDTVASDEEE